MANSHRRVMLELFPKSIRPAAASGPPLPAQGPMAERIGAFDWSRTSLGPLAAWPASLRMALHVLLANPSPACLWWGADRVNIPNQACLPLLGVAQATAVGVP